MLISFSRVLIRLSLLIMCFHTLEQLSLSEHYIQNSLNLM